VTMTFQSGMRQSNIRCAWTLRSNRPKDIKVEFWGGVITSLGGSTHPIITRSFSCWVPSRVPQSDRHWVANRTPPNGPGRLLAKPSPY
jgi:hypothetical protein